MIEVRNSDDEKEVSYILLKSTDRGMCAMSACSTLSKQEAIMNCFVDSVPDDYVITIKNLKFTDIGSLYVGCARAPIDNVNKKEKPVRDIYMAIPMGVNFTGNLINKIISEV
jgi:hydroxylamine reductase (hybrid-cluster protein)